MSSESPNTETKSGLPNDPATSGYNPNESSWKHQFNLFTGRMNAQGQLAHREDYYIKNEKADCDRCEEFRDYLFKYSPMVRFMQKNIQSLNGDLNESNVICRRCPVEITANGTPRRRAGGFHPTYGILICANELRDRAHLEDTLSHEMVHAWDHLRWKVDWMDLRHTACTEIRASNLSGECRWVKEFFTRKNRTITMQHQDCVRRRAIQSVMARPGCKDDVQAVKVVNEVWDSCFADTRPFDEIYR